MSVLSEFLHVVERFPDRTAIVDPLKTWTYIEVERSARRLASAVQIQASSDKVGILLPTSGEFVYAYFACMIAGKVPVPINFLLDPHQLEHIRGDAGLDLIITCKPFEQKAEAMGGEIEVLEELDVPSLPEMNDQPVWEDSDLATILYTSGTTGLPKGVMLTHGNFTSNVSACRLLIGFSTEDTTIGFLPLFHSFGLTATFLVPLLTGAKAVFLDRFHPGTAGEWIEREKVTILFAIPSMYRFFVLAAQKMENDFSSLRLCASGGEPLEDSLAEAFEQTFDFPLSNAYGLTETSPVVAINLPHAPKPGSIGPPISGQEVRIVGEDGKSVPPGQDGELWLKGPNIMAGYLNLEEETRAVLDEDGWFRTGDQARQDEDGYLYITGRIKELIKSSGEYIVPYEIEQVIGTHPAVFEVAVIGIPDESRGEVPKAFVSLKEGTDSSPDEIQALCRKELARFKVPREIEIREQLPHGPTGKVLKRLLKE